MVLHGRNMADRGPQISDASAYHNHSLKIGKTRFRYWFHGLRLSDYSYPHHQIPLLSSRQQLTL